MRITNRFNVRGQAPELAIFVSFVARKDVKFMNKRVPNISLAVVTQRKPFMEYIILEILITLFPKRKFPPIPEEIVAVRYRDAIG